MAITGTGTNILHITSSTDVVSSTTVMLLSSMRWVGATAAGHTCTVTDGAGNPLFSSVANAANFVDGWVFDSKWIAGLILSAMDTGALDVYLASK